MKALPSLLQRCAAAAVVAALALAGCSKDDAVAPCSKQGSEEAGDAKVQTGLPLEAPQQLPDRKSVNDSEPRGISDDGDDVGDGERNKKTKKRPSN
ncbi:MAG: hypothetical protein ACK4L7_00050 [Flavobacteriales bacterium]